MATTAQIELWHAEKVATQVTVSQAANGIHFGAWGETRVSDADLERLVGAVPARWRPHSAIAPTTSFPWPLPTPAKS